MYVYVNVFRAFLFSINCFNVNVHFIAIWHIYRIEDIMYASNSLLCRSQSFKEDDGTWKGNDDGKVVNNQPQRVMDDRNGMMAQAGYIGR